jgi:histidine phosphotransferase ChpT
MPALALDAIDLAALLSSRICHDIISPVGAIINGLEVLEEEKDPEMRGYALDLIKKSAGQASARLQFCRLAFGVAGSAGALIDTSDAESVARGVFSGERTQLDWKAPPLLMPKNTVKLILNLCLAASAAIPRGGTVEVKLEGTANEPRLTVSARGTNAKLPAQLAPLLLGEPDHAPSTPQDVQAYYAGLIAKAGGMAVTVTAEANLVAIEAKHSKPPACAGGGAFTQASEADGDTDAIRLAAG